MDMSENRIPQNLMVYHGLSWFIMVYHDSSPFSPLKSIETMAICGYAPV
jgi:hypothetical protein